MRQPTFEATRLIVPEGIAPGVNLSIMWAPSGAVPPIIDVIPMSASVTFTARPGREDAAEQVNQAWRADRARAVHAALPELTWQQGQVLVLAYYGGYIQVEIAALVGVPVGTVKARTAAGKQRLRTMLTRSCTDLATG